jgi:hypothetical protein
MNAVLSKLIHVTDLIWKPTGSYLPVPRFGVLAAPPRFANAERSANGLQSIEPN